MRGLGATVSELWTRSGMAGTGVRNGISVARSDAIEAIASHQGARRRDGGGSLAGREVGWRGIGLGIDWYGE